MPYKALRHMSDDSWGQRLPSLLLVSCNAAMLPSGAVSHTASSLPICHLYNWSELATQVCQRTFTAKKGIDVNGKT